MESERNKDLFWTFVKIILFCGLIGLLYLVRDIVIIFFLSLVFTIALVPIVNHLEKDRKIPRVATTSAFFLIFFLVIGLLFNTILEITLQEGFKFWENLPVLIKNFISILGISHIISDSDIIHFFEEINSNLPNQISSQSRSIVGIGLNIIDIGLQFLTFCFITFYMIKDWEGIKGFFLKILPKGSKDESEKVLDRIEVKLGAWLRGQFILMVVIGAATYIGLTLLGVKYAAALALTAAVLEAVPILGPVIAAIPALLVASSPEAPAWQPFAVIVLYLIIQQLEGNLIVPRVMNDAVGLHPVVVIIAIMVGGTLAGPVGSLLAIPFTAILMILYEEWNSRRHPKVKKDNSEEEEKT
jgi:predicted PurR-regulated permease PerM